MAQIVSSNQPVEIDVAGGTSFKTLVCVNTATLDGSADAASTETDCGIFTSTGAASYTISADAVCETAPTAQQVTYNSLLTAFINKTLVSVRVQNPTVTGSSIGTHYFHRFSARITALSLSKSSSSAYVSFSVTLQSDGAITITP